MLIHVVNKGELLWQIADYYQADINNILEINNLTNPNLLLVGQSLLIPTTNVVYTVRYGDTLWSIADRFKVSLQELLYINRIINPNLVYPGVVLTLPQRPRPGIEVNAYTYVFGQYDIPVLAETMNYLTYLTPFSYLVREDGRLLPINDEQVIQLSILNNVIPIMTISDTSYDSEDGVLAHAVLNNLNIMQTLIDNIVGIMKDKGYKGLNVSFEDVYPEDIEAYNNFLQLVAVRMHQENFFITSTIVPKFNDDETELMHEDQDYIAHGMIADIVTFLTYEWGWEGPPGPISPINKIKQVLDYAVSVIPSDKIFMGFQIYAMDWIIPYVEGDDIEIISVQEAMNRAYKYRVNIEYDETRQAPYFFYRDEQGRMHEIWFEDARSAQAKFDMVKEYKLRGISYWSLGYPFKQNWHLLNNDFIIIKEYNQ